LAIVSIGIHAFAAEEPEIATLVAPGHCAVSTAWDVARRRRSQRAIRAGGAKGFGGAAECHASTDPGPFVRSRRLRRCGEGRCREGNYGARAQARHRNA
jgi:hypothetical protein